MAIRRSAVDIFPTNAIFNVGCFWILSTWSNSFSYCMRVSSARIFSISSCDLRFCLASLTTWPGWIILFLVRVSIVGLNLDSPDFGAMMKAIEEWCTILFSWQWHLYVHLFCNTLIYFHQQRLLPVTFKELFQHNASNNQTPKYSLLNPRMHKDLLKPRWSEKPSQGTPDSKATHTSTTESKSNS